MMKLIAAFAAASAMALTLQGCTAAGAVAGGAIGHEVSDGSAAGTIGGAAVGGIIGHEIGKD
nr:glycine zipper 2TM domain-containing protein [Cupriavidus sp. AU9028]